MSVCGFVCVSTCSVGLRSLPLYSLCVSAVSVSVPHFPSSLVCLPHVCARAAGHACLITFSVCVRMCG